MSVVINAELVSQCLHEPSHTNLPLSSAMEVTHMSWASVVPKTCPNVQISSCASSLCAGRIPFNVFDVICIRLFPQPHHIVSTLISITIMAITLRSIVKAVSQVNFVTIRSIMCTQSEQSNKTLPAANEDRHSTIATLVGMSNQSPMRPTLIQSFQIYII